MSFKGCNKDKHLYFVQQWYGLSDPAINVLNGIESMRRFAGVDLAAYAIPDETAILHFQHLLEKHSFTKQIFEKTKPENIRWCVNRRGCRFKHLTTADEEHDHRQIRVRAKA